MTTEPVEPRRRVTRIGEIVGLAAVVGSLVFVGLQVRQAAEATRGATQQQLSEAANAVTLSTMDADFAELLARAREMGDWSGLGPAERIRLNAYYRMNFRLYEDAHYQFRLGNLDPELWEGWESNLAQAAGDAAVRHAWSQVGNARFTRPFRALLDSIIAAQ